MPQLVPVALLERGCKEKTGVVSYDLRVIAGLIAATAVGRIGATCKELQELTGVSHASNLLRLERERWVVRVGRVAGSTARIWAPTPHALRRLELSGWKPVLFTDEELERVDANVPGFLQPKGERAAS